MIAALKKSFNKFDALILLAAVFLFSHFDYANLSMLNKIYIASFAIWGVMKFIRVYIVFKNNSGKK